MAERAAAGGWKIGVLAALAAGFIRLLRSTLRLRFHGADQVRVWEREGRHFILAFWHRHLLLMPYAYRGAKISVLTSHSRDGELIARTIARFGVGTARGSSSRGGAMGLRNLLREAAAGGDVAFTPDGPTGPAGTVRPGVLLAAAASGLPIVAVAYSASRAKPLGSWDGMELPLPGARLEFVFADPLSVERGADMEAAGELLKLRLDGAEREARQRAGRESGDA